MPAKTPEVDGAQLLKALTAGFEAKPTKRGGKEGFVLIQHDGRTLAMASIKNTGAVRLEGSRLDRSLTIIDAKGVTIGRKAIEAVRTENLAKAREQEERKAARTSQPKGRPSGGKSVAAKRVEQAKAKAASGKLVRVLHNVDTDTATDIVDTLVERETPLIWEVNGRKRVLDTSLKMKDKTFVLLHASTGSVTDRELVSWLEHSNASVYRRDVLRPAHKARYVEYDEATGTVQLSPRGIAYVEENLLPKVT